MTSEPRNCCNGGKFPAPVYDECVRPVEFNLEFIKNYKPVYSAAGYITGWNRDRYNGIYRTREDCNYTGPWRSCQ